MPSVPCLLLAGLVLAVALPSARAGCKVTGTPVCYRDHSDGNRVLGSTNQNPATRPCQGSANSIEWCAQICANMSASLAGVEFGKECYCGSAVKAGAVKLPAGHCQMPCPNSPNGEKCGGFGEIAIYSFECSGAPVPEPDPVPYLINPCLNKSAPFAAMKFCDPTLDVDVRVADMISKMSIPEKIGALSSAGSGDITSLGIPSYNWWSEATHGISHTRFTDKTPETTNFAFPITTAMSFNRSLWSATAAQIGLEGRAFMNAGNAWSSFWAPVVNLAREPRWGRNLETPGEDPYLSGEYATYFVRSFEHNPIDEDHLQASACCKHYVANSMDHTTDSGVFWNRHTFDAYISQQDLLDSYMPPFQACVEQGRVSGLMCSYNSVNGVPSCANDWLLTTVARDSWDFDGYITSDCDAVGDVYNTHHYTATPEEAIRDSLRAGTDLDCGRFLKTHAQSALDKGIITEADMDARLSNLFRMRIRLGHFDPVGPLQAIPTSVVCSDEAIELSMDGTRQGVTMVKNVNKALPLSASVPSVAVIGPNANLSETMSNYYGAPQVCGLNYWNVVDAVKTHCGHVEAAFGVPSAGSNDTSGIAAAVALAKTVDTVVLALGTDLTLAREGHDADSIVFSRAQSWLIGNVTAAAKKPVIAVILSAIALDISPLMANPKVGAVLWTGQPSVTVLAVGDVLFGAAPPAGRMIQTLYPYAYSQQVSIFDFGMRPGPSPFPPPSCAQVPCPTNGTNPGRTHRFYTGKAVVPFGFGLSYTTWAYKLTSQPSGTVSLDPLRAYLADSESRGKAFPSLREMEAMAPLVEYRINVTNTGTVDSDDVVLGMLTPPGAGQNGVPLQTLFGFERVHVKAGQTVTVYLYPEMSAFMQISPEGKRYVLGGDYQVRFGLKESSELGMGFAAAPLSTQ